MERMWVLVLWLLSVPALIWVKSRLKELRRAYIPCEVLICWCQFTGRPPPIVAPPWTNPISHGKELTGPQYPAGR